MERIHCGWGGNAEPDSVLVLEAAKSDCLREMHACSFCSCPRQGLSHPTTEAAHLTRSLREYGRMSSKIPSAEKKPQTLSCKMPGVNTVKNRHTAAEQTLCWLELEEGEKTRGEGQLLNSFQWLEKLETQRTQRRAVKTPKLNSLQAELL